MTTDLDCNFVVLTTNRSGSEWVISTLNNYPHVTARGELFLPRPRTADNKWDSEFAYTRFVETKFTRLSVRPFSVFKYLDALYAIPGRVGFKLMYKQLGFFPEILLYFIRNHTRVVHLVRRNHLDVMLSYAVKAQIGQSHLLTGQSAPAELRVDLDTRNLVRKLAWLQQQQDIARRVLKLFSLPHLEVIYEELVHDQSQFRLIEDFLLISSSQSVPQSPLTRIRKKGHRDVIGNYEQVREVLVNSEFAGLLE